MCVYNIYTHIQIQTGEHGGLQSMGFAKSDTIEVT